MANSELRPAATDGIHVEPCPCESSEQAANLLALLKVPRFSGEFVIVPRADCVALASELLCLTSKVRALRDQIARLNALALGGTPPAHRAAAVATAAAGRPADDMTARCASCGDWRHGGQCDR